MNRIWQSLRPTNDVGRLRLWVIAAALAATALKLVIAARTFGSYDVHIWTAFATSVREHGPIGIYGDHPVMFFWNQNLYPLYNHPPASGWMLAAMNWLVDRGASFSFLIRVPATLADFGTALLVFELVRRLRSPLEAAIASVLVVFSPVLISVSGFHGNTDPVFVMFTLLSVYLVIRQRPAWAGVAIALAMSVKLVPIVVIPLLLVAVFRQGRPALAKFAGGGLAVFAVLWVPVLISEGTRFRQDVLGYSGVAERVYGVPQFGKWLELPSGWIDLYVGPGRLAVLAVCALVPALLVWRKPETIAPATGLALASFLLLSPAFGVQYLSWAVAGAYLISTWAGTVYNVLAGALAVQFYSSWSAAKPGHWYEAIPIGWRPREFALMVLAWVALLLVCSLALRPELRALNAARPLLRRGKFLDVAATPEPNSFPPRESAPASRHSSAGAPAQ